MEDELKEISDDLKDAEILLRRLVGSGSGGGPPEEKKVWLVYLPVENAEVVIVQTALIVTTKLNLEAIVRWSKGFYFLAGIWVER